VTIDPKLLVARGYDEIAHEYLRRYSSSVVRAAWLETFISALPTRPADILDLGCGAGIPVAKRLADLGHRVTGIDGSAGQIALARAKVGNAEFVQADMTTVELVETFFDGVAAFYSITHVPAVEQGMLIHRIAGWLRPGGVFVASFRSGSTGDWQGQWLGTEMFFSHQDEAISLSLVERAGLQVDRAETVDQDDEDTRFLWILARKPL